MAERLLQFWDIDAARSKARHVTGIVGLTLLERGGARLTIWSERHDVPNPCRGPSYYTVARLISRARAPIVLFPEGLLANHVERGFDSAISVANHMAFSDVERHDVSLLLPSGTGMRSVGARVPVVARGRLPTGAALTMVGADLRDEHDPSALRALPPDQRAAFAAMEVVSAFISPDNHRAQERRALRLIPPAPVDPDAAVRYLTARVEGIMARHFPGLAARSVADFARRCTAWHEEMRIRRPSPAMYAISVLMPIFDVVLLSLIDAAGPDARMHAFLGDAHRRTIVEMLRGGWAVVAEHTAQTAVSSCLDMATGSFVPSSTPPAHARRRLRRDRG